jgi:threonine dehydrogenase-like Zn-dependent dehydrogenase
MKQLLIKKGQIVVEDVPSPLVENGSVLVKVNYSLISAGTEMTGVTASGESLLRKALKQPEKVKKVLDMAKAQGISKTIDQVKGKLDSGSSGTPTGYSCSGIVIDVGESIDDIQIGDNVACAGAGYANHAEFVCVPRNLVVKVPDNLGLKEAASATLGSIAMQGVRRANPTFGETIAVIGLGLVGQQYVLRRGHPIL